MRSGEEGASYNKAALRLLCAINSGLIEVWRDHGVEVLPCQRVGIHTSRLIDEGWHMTSRPKTATLIMLAILG